MGAEERVERMVKFKMADETSYSGITKGRICGLWKAFPVDVYKKFTLAFDNSNPGLAPNPPAT